MLLVAGSMSDALTLAWFLAIAPAGAAQAERNPLVGWMLAVGGVGLVFCVKSLLAWIVAWRIARRGGLQSRIGRVVLPFAAAMMFVGTIFNLIAVAAVL